MANNYEGHSRSLIKPGNYTALSTKTGFQQTEHQKHGILRLYLPPLAQQPNGAITGSITQVNIYVPAPNIDVNSLVPPGVLDAVHEALFYQFIPAVPISVAGINLFTVGPGNPVGMSINGYWPPEFEVEVVMAGGSSIRFELDVLWLG